MSPDDVRVGDVYTPRDRRYASMRFTVTEVDREHRLAFGRRSTSRRRQPIDLDNLAQSNRYRLVERGPEPTS